MNRSKIFALMTIKNESDIVIETLEKASLWADKIFILDNMSDDGTWELINNYAMGNDKIVLWGRYSGRFYLALRQVIFKDYSTEASPGDWWCRLDGDEFYIDDPRDFLHSLDDSIDHVYNASFQYYYTEDDFRNETSNPSKESVTLRLKWYKCNHSEIRFVKHSNSICWPQNTEWPCNLTNPASNRIRLKHYQYRDINQIISRLKARTSADSGSSFTHEKVSVDEWYHKRKFSIPKDPELASLRIVSKSDLTDSDDFKYHDQELPPIFKKNMKRKIKNKVILFYMKYLNSKLFKI